MSYPNMYSEETPDHLQQGDIFLRFESKELPRYDPKESGFLILTYTCDLANPKDLTSICFCPIFKLDILIEDLVELYKNKKPENIEKEVKKRIHDITNHKSRFIFFLSPDPVFDNQPAFADLGQINNISKDFMEIISKFRKLSLNHPWKEKLGFMVGYLFNRIATEDTDKCITDQYIDNSNIIKKYLDNKMLNT